MSGVRVLLLVFSAVILSAVAATSTQAACQCKQDRWVTLGLSTSPFTSRECKRTFQEAKELDGARGMRFNKASGQCSLCFGNNWSCRRESAKVQLEPVKQAKPLPKPAQLAPQAELVHAPVVAISDLPYALRSGSVTTAKDDCEGNPFQCGPGSQNVNRSAKGDLQINASKHLKHLAMLANPRPSGKMRPGG